MNKSEAKCLWTKLVKKYYGKDNSISDKLLRMQFIRRGEMKPETKAYKYAVKHFSALLKIFEEMRDKNDE